jgi:ornithine--oxo-acid transaminase
VVAYAIAAGASTPTHNSAVGWVTELVEERGAEALDLHAETINPQFVRLLRTIGFDRRWARAQGQYLWDSDGNRYLDVLGGFGVFNVGRNNPRIREALVEALELERPGSVQLGVDSLPALLAEDLLRRAPANVERVLFTNSGTESVEAAIKLGRAATGRSRVLSAEHGFHGLTLGALSATADSAFTSRFGPLLPGFEKVPWDDLDALEEKLRAADVALFVVEPVQGKGVNIPSSGYLAGAQELCRRYGTLFCLDEVQTGFGRTGRFFALEHWGLEPDLITVAKSLSGGYVPVGALLMSTEVYDGVFNSLPNAVSHGSTFAPNDLAMVAGLATLRELDDQGLVERSARLGELLLERTRPFVERFEVVADVRGIGLMWAIEFQEPPGGSRTWKLLERIQPGLFSQLVVVPLFRDHRVLSQVAGHGLNVLKAIPPLVLSEEDVDSFVSALEETIARAEKMPRALVRFALRAARAGRGPRRRLARA